ncbi:MAG: hypothetical protein JSU61_12065 [Fidelibacterota bacterium]|nr:MAG: hypothetical protein JSU61_12065 [Candidatus Neomarinimicrobiota bacterium]
MRAIYQPLLIVIALSTIVILAGCAAMQEAANDRPRYDSNRITAEEIEICGATNVYDVIQMLRPNWLRPRYQIGINSPNIEPPAVYINNMYYGGPRELVSFQPQAVAEMRYMDARDTNIYLGHNHPGGAIVVTMK